MHAADRAQILQALLGRRDAIADNWYQAIVRTCFLPLRTTEIRQHLVELTEQVLTLLVAEPFERRRARAVGTELARFRYVQPEILGTAQEVLACQLVECLPADQAVTLQPRLAALLGELAAGFFHQARETILAEQEHIHRALIRVWKQAEKTLREREERERALLNAPTDPILVVDRRGTVVALNEAAVRILGKSENDLVGTSAFDLFAPEVIKRGKARANQVFRSGKSVRFEDQVEGRWFDTSMYPVFDTQGRVTQIAILARDTTERRRAERALHDSEARYRAISELISNFAYALGVEPGGTIAYEWVTEHFTHITGFTLDETIARGGWPSVVHPDDMPIAVQHLQALLSGRPDVSEFRIVTRRGEVRWLRDYGRPVRDEMQGRVIRIYGAAQDITERRQMEQHLFRVERLLSAGRFAAGLAHEVNNPLQAIQSSLELALDFDLDPDERQKYLRVISQEIERLAGLTRRVLNFAQPADDTRHPIYVSHLMQETLELLGRQLQHANVQVTTDFPTDLPPVFVAPKQIVQVLLNLTINALEAMPDGGHLQVAARVDGDMLALSLTNDGPPIPPEYIEDIFDAFFTTKPKGTGLGLAISYSIVHRHGGTIRVENLSGGQGVTFTVMLPLVPVVERHEVVP